MNVVGLIKSQEERNLIRVLVNECVRSRDFKGPKDLELKLFGTQEEFLDSLAQLKNIKLVVIDSLIENYSVLLESVLAGFDGERPVIIVLADTHGGERGVVDQAEELNALGVELVVFRPYTREQLVLSLQKGISWMQELPHWVKLVRAGKQLVNQSNREAVKKALGILHQQMPDNSSIALLYARVLGVLGSSVADARESYRVLDGLLATQPSSILALSLASQVAKKFGDRLQLMEYAKKTFLAAPSRSAILEVIATGKEIAAQDHNFKWIALVEELAKRGADFTNLRPLFELAIEELSDFEKLEGILNWLKNPQALEDIEPEVLSRCYFRLRKRIEELGGLSAINNRLRAKMMADFGSLLVLHLSSNLELVDDYVSTMIHQSRVIESEQKLSLIKRKDASWKYFYLGMAKLAMSRDRRLEASDYLLRCDKMLAQFSSVEKMLFDRVRDEAVSRWGPLQKRS